MWQVSDTGAVTNQPLKFLSLPAHSDIGLQVSFRSTCSERLGPNAARYVPQLPL